MVRKASILAALLVGGSAQAATYVGSANVGGTSATYTIVTDGTTGTLSSANFVSFSGTVTSASQSQSFTNGNFVNISGSGISATATQILFNTSTSGFLAFGNSSGNLFTALCWSGTGSSCGVEAGPSIILAADYADDFDVGSINGTVTIASIGGAVPEPSAWAFLILGLGAVGAAMRRRTATKVSFA